METGIIVKVIEKDGNQKDIDNLIDRVSYDLLSDIDPGLHLKMPVLIKPQSRSTAALKSMIWPGWGDFPDRKITGILMASIQLGAIAGTGVFHLDYKGKLDEYNEAREKYGDVGNFATYSEYKAQRELMLSKREDAINSKTLRNVFLVSALVIRMVGIVESAIFIPNTEGQGHSFTSSIGDEGIILAWQYGF